MAKNPTATAILFMALISFMMTKRVESWGWVTGIIMMAINEPIKKGEVSKPLGPGVESNASFLSAN